MRDVIKKNESKFGSKPITPLALKNKRKQLGEASHLNTPSMLVPSRGPQHNMSKMTTPGSTILGASRLIGTSNMAGPSKSVLHQMQAKSKAIAKRKSRTPGGKRRLSKIMMAQAAKDQLAEESKLTQDTTLCSTRTFMQTTTSTLSSTSQMSSTSSLASKQKQAFASNFAQKKTTHLAVPSSYGTSKHPPLSASAKYVAAGVATASRNMIDRMTSTASNTFIEEESFTALENACNVTNKYVPSNMATAAAAKITQMVADVNYMEFSVNQLYLQSVFTKEDG
jgi:hypothetical protein